MIEIFGNEYKQTIVLDLLLSHPYTQYTKSDIAEITNISPKKDLDTFIDKLLNYKIIKTTKKIKNIKLYQINMESRITQTLNSFQNQIADILIKKEMEKQKETNPNIKPIKPFKEINKKKNKKK